MNKTEIVAGSCIALLAAVSIGQLYLDKTAQPQTQKQVKMEASVEPASQAEVKPVTVDEVIETYLSSINEGTDVGRQVALGSLLDELEGPEFGKSALKPESAESFANAAIAVVESSGAETSPSSELKDRVAGFLAARVRGPVSRDYVLKTLDQGSPNARDAVLAGLGGPLGLGGKSVYEKVQDLGAKGLINGESLPGVLRRTGGKKAIDPIIAIMKSTDNVKVISSCVIALQDIGEVSAVGPALERLEATGMIDKPKILPWISGALFSKYMETAQGSALSRGIKAMRSRPSLVKLGLPALEKGLAGADAETRRAAAEAIKKAVIAKHISAKIGEQMLAGRLSIETEPVLKAELTGGLEQVRGMMDQTKVLETKPQ
jgi:hypothetical protein